MKRILAIVSFTIALLPLVGNAQTGDCRPSTPASSPAYREFSNSPLPAKWSGKDLGPLSPSGEFRDCTYESEGLGFSMQLTTVNQKTRVVGYATHNGQHKALAFEVTEKGLNEYEVKAYNLNGSPLFQYQISGGSVTGVQALGPVTCSETYLVGLIGMGAGVTGGPVGVGIGAGLMVWSLWRAGCI